MHQKEWPKESEIQIIKMEFLRIIEYSVVFVYNSAVMGSIAIAEYTESSTKVILI